MGLYGNELIEYMNEGLFKKNKINISKKELDIDGEKRTIIFKDSFKDNSDKIDSIFPEVEKEIKAAIKNEKQLLKTIYSSNNVKDIVDDIDKQDKDENYFDWFEVSDKKENFKLTCFTKYGQLYIDDVKNGKGSAQNVEYND